MKLNAIPHVDRVLSISAHPDDSEFFAGGTLATWSAAGTEVTLVVCTDGGQGGRGISNTADIRQDEQAKAAGLMGINNVIRLDYPDGDLTPSDELRDRFIALIRQYRPDIIACHHPQTMYTHYGERVQMGHSDHRAAGTALLDAVYPRAANPNFLPGTGDPHLPSEVWLFDCTQPDYLVDVSQGFDAKIKALTAHASQEGAAGGLVRAAHRVGALFGNDESPAEAFSRLRIR